MSESLGNKQIECSCDQFIKQANMFGWGEIRHNILSDMGNK